jgi:PKD repeat protein
MIAVSNPQLVAGFTASKTNISRGETVIFNDASQNNPTEWNWTFEGGSPKTSTEKNPSVQYNTPGVYDVILTVSNADGSDQMVKKSYISVSIQKPKAEFVALRAKITAGDTIRFIDKSENAQAHFWFFDGGSDSISTERNPVIQYNLPGIYDVSLKVVNIDGSDEIIREGFIIVETNAPKANFSADNTRILQGEIINFIDQSSDAQTYLWTFEGGSPAISTEKNPSVTYNTSGIFTVTLKVTNETGTDELIIHEYVEVTAKPQGEAGKDLATRIDQVFDTAEPSIIAYPVPATDNLFVKLDNWTDPVEVRITDLSGRVIFSHQTYDEYIKINVVNYNRGLYILTVTDGLKNLSQRVTVH